jgi:alkyl hydroperoxide reductase subunit AhpC
MSELREFAQHSDDLERIGVRLVPISVDTQQHAHDVWEKAAQKKFTILTDPGAKVIRQYGLLHEHGSHDQENLGSDIALRTTILVAPDGRERWRRVSHSVPDIPSWDETLAAIKAAQEPEHGMDSNH